VNTCTCEHTESCDVADQLSNAIDEIERLTIVVETQTGCIVKEQSQLSDAKKEIEQLKVTHINQADVINRQLTTATLEIDRVNRIAEEELDEVNGKMEKLRDVVERVIKIERQRSETTSLLLIAEASLPKL